MHHRPLKQEHKQAPEPVFSKGKEEARPFFPKYSLPTPAKEGGLTHVCTQVNMILTQACEWIRDSHPYQAQIHQSKALELAQQYIDSEIQHISYIQDILYTFKCTLKEKHFTCVPPIDFSQTIYLGQDFLTLPDHQQVFRLLCKSIEATHIPSREGLPSSQIEHIRTDEAWAKYILLLLKLLPEEPYLITGTPIPHTTIPDIVEEPVDDEDIPSVPFSPLESSDISGTREREETDETTDSPRRRFSLRYLFRRKKN